MRAALAYAPRPGPLGRARPWVAAAYLAPLAVCAFTFSNPIVLVAAASAALGGGLASGAGGALRQPLRWSLALGLMVIAVNAIVSQRGATILMRGFECRCWEGSTSAPRRWWRGLLALRIVTALIVFAVWRRVDPDRVLRAIRPFAARSPITATLIARCPARRGRRGRLSEAGRLRGPAAAAARPRRDRPPAVRGIAGPLVDVASTSSCAVRARVAFAPARHSAEPGEAALLAPVRSRAALMIAAATAGVAGTSPIRRSRAMQAPDARLRRRPAADRPGSVRPRADRTSRRRAGRASGSEPRVSERGATCADPVLRSSPSTIPLSGCVTLALVALEFGVAGGVRRPRPAVGIRKEHPASCRVRHRSPFHGGEVAGDVSVAVARPATDRTAELAAGSGSSPGAGEPGRLDDGSGRLERRWRARRGGDRDGSSGRGGALALASSRCSSARPMPSRAGAPALALGAALVTGPPLLLLDEPTSQLEPVDGDELISLLRG